MPTRNDACECWKTVRMVCDAMVVMPFFFLMPASLLWGDGNVRLRLAKNGVMFGKKEVNGMVCRIFLFTLHSEKDNVFFTGKKSA